MVSAVVNDVGDGPQVFSLKGHAAKSSYTHGSFVTAFTAFDE